MNMSKEEVTAIMSLAKKIIQHENDKEWLQDLQDESDSELSSQEIIDAKADKNKDYAMDNMIRESEDQHDMTGRPGPGNCECCDGK